MPGRNHHPARSSGSNQKPHSRSPAQDKNQSHGQNVSHSKRRTKRRFNVNLFTKKFYWVEQDCWITLTLSAAGLRTINKMGLDAAIKQAAGNGYLTEIKMLY